MEKKSRRKRNPATSVVRQKRSVGKGHSAAPLSDTNAGLKMASLFMNGRSQAVRLPKEFRFEGTHVYVSRSGDRVILSPINSRWDWLNAIFGSAPDFPDRDQGQLQVRPEIEALFDESD